MLNLPLREAVKDYCKTERQWRRSERIAHYRLRLKHATAEPLNSAKFWRTALELNGARAA